MVGLGIMQLPSLDTDDATRREDDDQCRNGEGIADNSRESFGVKAW